MQDCFFYGLDLVDQSGLGIGVGVACPGGQDQVVVPAYGVLEDTYRWGPLDNGMWQATVTLGTLPVQVQAMTQFDMQ